MGNRIKPFFILFILLWSCNGIEEEKLYNKMASEFCDCYNQSISLDTLKKSSDCIQTILASHRTEILTGRQDSSREYTEAAISLLEKSRIAKYCPSFKSDILRQFDKQRELSKQKLKFNGLLVNQQEFGVGTGRLYMIELSDKNDSILEFLSADTINTSQISSNRMVSVIYYMMNDKKWIDTVIIE